MKDKFISILYVRKRCCNSFALFVVILCAILASGLIACTSDTGNNLDYNTINESLETEKDNDYVINSDTEKSKKIGYIRNFDATKNSFEFDEIEWITINDTERIKELNLNVDDDFPNDYYINNSSLDTAGYEVTDETECQIIDWNNIGEPSIVDLDEFATYVNEHPDYSSPFWIVFENNLVISIEEQYLP